MFQFYMVIILALLVIFNLYKNGFNINELKLCTSIKEQVLKATLREQKITFIIPKFFRHRENYLSLFYNMTTFSSQTGELKAIENIPAKTCA